MMRAWSVYDYVSSGKPWAVLLVLLGAVAATGMYYDRFRLDASADSLLLENDSDLRYYRETVSRYGTTDFLAIACTPKNDRDDLFSEDTLANLRSLHEEIERVDGIQSVLGILNAPLFASPPVPLSQLAESIRDLETPDTDINMARRELLNSPIFRDLLISRDGKSVMLLAFYEPDTRLRELLSERERLRTIQRSGNAGAGNLEQLQKISRAYDDYSAEYARKDRERIHSVRAVIDKHREHFNIFLGGVPMIINDMIEFIKSDLAIFGAIILLFLIATLTILFRNLAWVVIPLLCCLLPVAAMFGVLGLFDWRVTVISSNFAALLLILTMSMTVHLIVRYQEMQKIHGTDTPGSVIGKTMRYMLKPCLYTSLTTIVAFTSLTVSGIRPVIDFGYIMAAGVVGAFVFVFLFFPNMVTLTNPRPSPRRRSIVSGITRFAATLSIRHNRIVVAVCACLAIIGIAGGTQLVVENRFIDYFSEHSEVHRGMLKIDRDLGGTMPFDVIVSSPEIEDRDDDAFVDEELAGLLGDDYAADTVAEQKNYWLNTRQVSLLNKIHDALDSLHETGKVLSLATVLRVMEAVNGAPLSDLELNFIPRLLPDDIKEQLITPHLSEDGNEVRFNVRVIDSDPDLNRHDFLQKVDNALRTLGLQSFRITGALVLYDNTLQSLYQSQILTLGMVLLIIMLMFIVLFRSFSLATIGIIPNVLSAGLILGLMGWLRIPLDLMTITIAAITIGIAVDNTIHYIVRFKRELPCDGNYRAAVRRCHNSIGRAIYYTSSIIVLGFSVLTLSNFTPTIYFGLLTGIAMLAALLATLTLLPSLLILFRPLKQQAHAAQAAARTDSPRE